MDKVEELIPPLYLLQGVSKEYPMGDTVVRALDTVDLEIQRGDYMAILGPSGSGKSTLMHILGFMDSPSGGRLVFDGRDVTTISRSERATTRARDIGFVFQSFNLLSRLSVVENVLLPTQYARVHWENPLKRVEETLSTVGLSHRVGHRPNQLSGGERQRVAIARALINQPKLILADEPTGNLDSRNSANILDLFDQLAGLGNTIVLVTHDPAVASHATRIIEVLDGKISERSGEGGGAE